MTRRSNCAAPKSFVNPSADTKRGERRKRNELAPNLRDRNQDIDLQSRWSPVISLPKNDRQFWICSILRLTKQFQ